LESYLEKSWCSVGYYNSAANENLNCINLIPILMVDPKQMDEEG
jgi:hypothetical protein